MKLQIVDASGLPLDAHLEIDEGEIIFHSRGGARGGPAQRNTEYGAGLRMLLEVISEAELKIEGIWVDSTVARKLPLHQRSIWDSADQSLSPSQLFTALSDRMKKVGRTPNTSARGGNSTKRLRIALSRPVAPADLPVLLPEGPAAERTKLEEGAKKSQSQQPSRSGWTDHENDLIVADYFEMLADEMAGRSYNKAEHRRSLRSRLENKSDGSIEFKHQNISAALQHLGLAWVQGYKPRHNFQASLVDAIGGWLKAHPAWLDGLERGVGLQPTRPVRRLSGIADQPVRIEKAPTEAEERIATVVRKIDFAARDEKNRELGRAGEELVLEYERSALIAAGRDDLAKRVRWVSQEDGDGAGYDIASFFPDGRERLLEVKTTNGGERNPFFISPNELAVAEQNQDSWRLVRVWNFARDPRAFELRSPLDNHVALTATSFRASFV